MRKLARQGWRGVVVEAVLGVQKQPKIDHVSGSDVP